MTTKIELRFKESIGFIVCYATTGQHTATGRRAFAGNTQLAKQLAANEAVHQLLLHIESEL